MIQFHPRHLPPMTTLRCFAAAARHSSFSRAAGDLALTQSAVSRQIARLEQLLGIRLFDRHGPRVVLTEAGRTYAQAIESALLTIQRASWQISSARGDKTISVATLPSFGMRWLAPRLAGLARHAPDLVVNFAARSDEFNLELEQFDAAIHFGQPNWHGAEHDRLFGERSIAVAAPALLENCHIKSPKDVLEYPLLAQTQRQDAWLEWFRHANVPDSAPQIAAVFDHFSMLSQAVVGGAGIALIPDFLIRDELASQMLVPVLDITMESDDFYYLVYPQNRLDKSDFKRFRSWLIAEAAQSM